MKVLACATVLLVSVASPVQAQDMPRCAVAGHSRGIPSSITLALDSADESGTVLSGTVCFPGGTTNGSVRLIASLSPDTTFNAVIRRGRLKTQGIEVWAGSAAPDEIVQWTTWISGSPGEASWGTALASAGGSMGAVSILYYGIRSGQAVSAPLYQGLAEAEYKALLERAGLEGAETERIRATSPSLYWRLTNDYRTPQLEFLTVVGPDGSALAGYEWLPDYMLAELPDSLQSRYNNPEEALRRAGFIREDPDLDFPRFGLTTEGLRVRDGLPEHIRCTPATIKAQTEGPWADAYIRCLHRQADWYRAQGLVELEPAAP